MATVNEGLNRHGNWIFSYDLGRRTLINSYGQHTSRYRQFRRQLTANVFVRIQQSSYRHPGGCSLAACMAVATNLQLLGWTGLQDVNGNPHVRSVRISVQANPFMDITLFVQGGPMPAIPPM